MLYKPMQQNQANQIWVWDAACFYPLFQYKNISKSQSTSRCVSKQ